MRFCQKFIYLFFYCFLVYSCTDSKDPQDVIQNVQKEQESPISPTFPTSPESPIIPLSIQAPKNFKVELVFSGMYLTWEKVENAIGYIIYKRHDLEPFQESDIFKKVDINECQDQSECPKEGIPLNYCVKAIHKENNQIISDFSNSSYYLVPTSCPFKIEKPKICMVLPGQRPYNGRLLINLQKLDYIQSDPIKYKIYFCDKLNQIPSIEECKIIVQEFPEFLLKDEDVFINSNSTPYNKMRKMYVAAQVFNNKSESEITDFVSCAVYDMKPQTSDNYSNKYIVNEQAMQSNINMVYIPGREYNDYTSKFQFEYERTNKYIKNTMSDIAISDDLITYKQYKKVYDWALNNDYTFIFEPKNLDKTSGKDYPVIGICYKDIIVWCNAASEYYGLNPCYLFAKTCIPIKNANLVKLNSFDTFITLYSSGFTIPSDSQYNYITDLMRQQYVDSINNGYTLIVPSAQKNDIKSHSIFYYYNLNFSTTIYGIYSSFIDEYIVNYPSYWRARDDENKHLTNRIHMCNNSISNESVNSIIIDDNTVNIPIDIQSDSSSFRVLMFNSYNSIEQYAHM